MFFDPESTSNTFAVDSEVKSGGAPYVFSVHLHAGDEDWWLRGLSMGDLQYMKAELARAMTKARRDRRELKEEDR